MTFGGQDSSRAIIAGVWKPDNCNECTSAFGKWIFDQGPLRPGRMGLLPMENAWTLPKSNRSN